VKVYAVTILKWSFTCITECVFAYAGNPVGSTVPLFLCQPETVTLDLLCDGNDDCPGGDDETTPLCESKQFLVFYCCSF